MVSHPSCLITLFVFSETYWVNNSISRVLFSGFRRMRSLKLAAVFDVSDLIVIRADSFTQPMAYNTFSKVIVPIISLLPVQSLKISKKPLIQLTIKFFYKNSTILVSLVKSKNGFLHICPIENILFPSWDLTPNLKK